MTKEELLEIIEQAARDGRARLNLVGRSIKELPAEIGQLKNLQELYLSDNQLTSVPDSLEQLTNLMWLCLSHNQLTSVSDALGQLKNLRMLDLSENRLGSVPASLGQLKNLQELLLSRNQLTSVPDTMGWLSKLEKLDLDGNKFTSVPDWLGQLSNLQELYLRFNKLTSVPTSLGTLKKLKVLNLYRNQITSVPAWLGELNSLKTLWLSGNQLTSVPKSLGQLSSLQDLGLTHNQLTSIPDSLGRLSNLQHLYLSKNRLTLVPGWLDQLRNLIRLELSGNQITELPSATLELELDIKWEWKRNPSEKGIFLADNPLEKPPIEIVKRGKGAVKEWFKALEEEGERLLDEVKVLLVGYGGAGKTSLVRRLTRGEFKKNEPKTHGVRINDWKIKVDGEVINVHFWDYGGQGIMQATHRVFFSQRSLYVLVIDARQESNPEEWLKSIESLGGKSPVLVVINKIDEHAFGLNEPELERKYPNIKGFYHLSCKSGDGLRSFKEGLKKHIVQIEMREIKWPRHWAKVREQLGQLKNDYITYAEYEDICRKEGVIKETRQRELIRILHELGVMLHFPERNLADTEVLNPEWATEGIYKIINSKELKKRQGKLPANKLNYVLNVERLEDQRGRLKKYSKKEQNYIAELMNKFELCYELDDDTILVPDLLTEQEPRKGLPKEIDLRFYFEYNFLPAVVMPRFMVKSCADLDANLCWRTGAVLKNESFSAVAVVRQDRRERRIYVEVSGRQARDYFATIRRTILEINNSFEKLDVTEWVPLPDESNHAVKYLDLIGHETARPRREEKFVGELQKGYQVAKLLGSIESRKETGERIKEMYDLRGVKVEGDLVMDGDKINVKGDAIGSAFGRGASAQAGDITVVRQNIENSSGLDEDTKAKLSKACEELEKLKMCEEDVRDVLNDLEQLRGELAKPAEERNKRGGRIKKLWGKINIIAQPVAAVLSTISSIAQLSG